ncbi:MAG: methyltransferase domain-containing protein [Candidatus Hydrogenedentes bacterium]|nr:methyltransferase domain-containing protein [Candidatus Hydrogenedentota bacterium]
MSNPYVHGYDPRESVRLQDQASTLDELLHGDTAYPDGSRVLEAGCGVGAQTVILAKRSPGAQFTSVDISPASLAQAREAVERAGFTNVTFHEGDVFDLPFDDAAFDHVFVCFVLEHLADPEGALAALRRVIKPGGTLTVIEGDHGSTFMHPHNDDALKAVAALVELQARAGGNANIGRQLYPLLTRAGYRGCRVSPRMVYVDSSRPNYVEGFTKNTFTAMIEGIRSDAIAQGILDATTFDNGIAGLCRAAEEDGVFCYTFFKAVASV